MKKVPCPYCKDKEVLSEQNGRATTNTAIFPRMQNVMGVISDVVTSFSGGPKTVSAKEALNGCKACGDSGEIEDVTDTSENDQKAADYLESKSERILELETKLGNSPGGNKVSRVAGAKIEIIGRTLNTAKSYTKHTGKASYRSGGEVHEKGRASVPNGPEKDKGTNVITGNNPPANTGGGLYYIMCSNKFKLVAGAQGIEISSNGPISIDGGQMRFTGAEVTIGGSQGPTVIEGDHLQLNGKSISLTPTGASGAVSVDGSIATTGNFQAGGAYIDNLYFSNAVCPEKQDISKISSQTDLITGPAKWGYSAAIYALQNTIKWIKDSTTDVTLSQTMSPLNPRSMMKTADNITNLTYTIIPQELTITGYCLVDGTPRPVFNLPHTHQLPDTPHSHAYTVPAITYKGRTAESVRAEADAAGINSRVPASAGGPAGDPTTIATAALALVGSAGTTGEYKLS